MTLKQAIRNASAVRVTAYVGDIQTTAKISKSEAIKIVTALTRNGNELDYSDGTWYDHTGATIATADYYGYNEIILGS